MPTFLFLPNIHIFKGYTCFQVANMEAVRPAVCVFVPHPWDSPGKNTGVGCHFLLQCMKVKSESEVAQS